MSQDHTPFLCFLTDNDHHIELCLRYWALDPGRRWKEPFSKLLSDAGLSQWELTNLLKSACSAHLLYLRCKSCRTPLRVRTRSEYSPLKGAVVQFGRQSRSPMCADCEAEVRVAVHEPVAFEAEHARSVVDRALEGLHARARSVDFGTLSYVQTFLLYAVLVAADVGPGDQSIPALASQAFSLSPTAGLADEIYTMLYEDGILLPAASSCPNVFRSGGSSGTIKFNVSEVSWVLAKDSLGRSLQEIVEILFDRLEHPEPAAVEELWYMIAVDECKRYFVSQCERYRFTEPGIYTDKVAAAIHHYLDRCSIGQAWNIIYYAVKNLAALAQEGRHTRQHIYNMMPGAIRRYADFRLGNQHTIHPWRRATPTAEAWVTSILLDKVLKNGNVLFEKLSGHEVYGYVSDSTRTVSDLDNS